MARVVKPWCIEIEFNEEADSSAFYVVRRFVADVRDIHLVIDDEGELKKLSIPRSSVARVLLVGSKK